MYTRNLLLRTVLRLFWYEHDDDDDLVVRLTNMLGPEEDANSSVFFFGRELKPLVSVKSCAGRNLGKITGIFLLLASKVFQALRKDLRSFSPTTVLQSSLRRGIG